jgi:hypothetical protein
MWCETAIFYGLLGPRLSIVQTFVDAKIEVIVDR